MLAKMIMLLDGARLQIWKAAWLADNSHPDARIQGLMAKVRASRRLLKFVHLQLKYLVELALCMIIQLKNILGMQ